MAERTSFWIRVLLLVDGKLVAPGVNGQGRDDDDEHDGAADDELDKGEPLGAPVAGSIFHACVHEVTC